MDFETMMTINSLQKTMEFMRDAFPWISLLVLLVTVLGVVRTEKRKRTLLLEKTDEEARIQALPDLSKEQKEQLLKAAAPLPATKEAFPFPDIPLRLVSALAKVFGFLKIVLFLGAIYSISRIAQMPDSTMSVTQPIVIVFLMFGGFILLAVFQIVASTKVTRGSNKARRFLIFMAVLELGATMHDPGMAHAGVWRMIIILMSGYMLWVLLLRKCAQESVVFNVSPTRIWQKITVLGLCLLFALTTAFDFKVNAQNSFHKVESSMSSSSNHGITVPISRIYLQAGDASKDTIALMRDLKEKLNTPTELIGFREVAPHTMSGGHLYLLVSKTLEAKKEKIPEMNMSKGLRNSVKKSRPEFAQFFQPQPSGDAEIAFKVEPPFSHRYFAWGKGRPEIHQMNSPDVGLGIRAEYNRGGREKALEEVGDSVAKAINKLVADRAEKQTVTSLPAPLSTEPKPLEEPALGCMKNAVRVAGFFSPKQQISFYRLSEYSPEASVAVSNELVSVGWKHSYGDRFQKGDEQIFMHGRAQYSRELSLPHIHLIHSKCRKLEIPESFAVDFCRSNYADFIGIFYARAVPAEILREATLKYLEQSDLSARELYNVYNSISGVDELDTIKPGLLCRFAKELHGEAPREQIFDLYQNLGKELTVGRKFDDECYDKINAIYSDQITHLELIRDTNGMDHAEITLSGIGRPQWVTFSKTRNDPSESRQHLPVYFLSWVETLEDGKFKSHHATPTGSGTSEGTEFESRYSIVRNFSRSGCSGNGSWGSGSYFSLKDRTRPGDLSLLHDIVSETNELTLEVLYYDKSLIISRAPDGRYYLDKMVMTKEQLIRALDAMQKDKYGLVVMLKKSDRPDFKAILAELPDRPGWIKYENPPEPTALTSE